MMRLICLQVFFLLICFISNAQEGKKNLAGIISGNLVDSASNKSVEGASIELISENKKYNQLSLKNGEFLFSEIPFGYYKISITSVEYSNLIIDSIHVREERYDFNLGEIRLFTNAKDLETIIVYTEKPLIESKDGNITFNVGESAVAAGSNASELLNNIPLVSKDQDGKILVRGKEPKILIDDKPVELNLQQLQDLLESLPGSSIEKIEVMTNPPPQYASEQGGVINIVTKKGKVGRGGRISFTGGTRGEGSMNGNFNYRKNKFAININAGGSVNRFETDGYSTRKNLYADSSNYFNTQYGQLNKSKRPNIRVNMDYEIKKNHTLNFVAQYNQNDFNNRSYTEYSNINRMNELYKLSEREINSKGDNYNSNLSLTYTIRGKKAGDQLRIISSTNFSSNLNNRLFYQRYLQPDHSFNGVDSTQQQITNNQSSGVNVRINYDKALLPKKTFLSAGTIYNKNSNTVDVDAFNKKKPENIFVNSDLLSNQFKFRQQVINFRSSIKQIITERFSITAGIAAEATSINFDLIKSGTKAENSYWNFLPFANINKNWNDKLNLTFSYRRTIRRPGINELNPTIDFSDPYNVRFGNYQLKPSLAHNFNLVAGKTKPKYFVNFGVGFNKVEDIFSQLRTLLGDGKTQVTWENISNRKEYEVSTWNGYTLNKKIKINLSASYTYNKYSNYDKKVRRFRDGGSFTSTLNGNYSSKDIWNFTGNFTTNRFANPQGKVSWSVSMNLGIQKKFFDKRFTATFNLIDPFFNQERNSYTNSTNFELKSYNTTQTKNFRLTVAYNFTKVVKKKPAAPGFKK